MSLTRNQVNLGHLRLAQQIVCSDFFSRISNSNCFLELLRVLFKSVIKVIKCVFYYTTVIISLVAFHNHILFNPKEKKMLYRMFLGEARSSCVSMIKFWRLILMEYINSIFFQMRLSCYMPSECVTLSNSELSFSLHFGC